MKSPLFKRIFILILLFTSVIIGMKYFYKYQSLLTNLCVADKMINLKGQKKLTTGIYIVYPLDGSMCSGCLYNLSLRLKEYYGKPVFVLFPEKTSIAQKGEDVFKPVFYSTIHNSLMNKMFFLNDKGEIVFLCKLGYLMGGKKQNLKNMIYGFRWDTQK